MNLEKKYLRFKDIPDNEISNIYCGDSGKIGEEIGVSCFELTEDSFIKIPISIVENELVTNNKIEALLNDLSWMMGDFLSDRITAYVITGNEIGIGSDGEPLLKNIKEVSKLNYNLEIINSKKLIIPTTEVISTDYSVNDLDIIISDLKKIQLYFQDKVNNKKIDKIFNLINKL